MYDVKYVGNGKVRLFTPIDLKEESSLKLCDDEEFLYTEEVDVMMSTGMKDVNDKEIYEGDIVRCTVYDNKSMGGYYGGLVEAEGVVEYDFEKAAFVVEGITLSILVEEEEDARTYLEVLGNKYENPELLEKIK
jgi:uncharacterized phage protein (TIGR01671 family)